MPSLAVEIVRFVDEHQPGSVECKLVDVNNEVHLFMEKAPIVSTEDLWSASAYPRAGPIRCEVLASWNEGNACLVKVTTENPLAIESTTGQTKFVVLASQLNSSYTALRPEQKVTPSFHSMSDL
jgi:hypothetical protein